MTSLPLSTLLFAQDNSASDAVAAIIGIIAMVIGLVIVVAAIALMVYTIYTYFTSLDAIPPQFRTMEPGMIFLMFIPCFGIIWIFFIVTKIPESFRNYFWATGNHRFGDCGAALGMWYAILAVISSIPYVNFLTIIPTLILLVMFVLKLNEMKKAVLADAAAGNVPQKPVYGGEPGQYTGDPNNPYAPPENQY